MTQMAGNINKFMNAGLFDATALAKTAADIEHGYDLAEINRDFGLGASALSTFAETERMKAQRELEKYLQDERDAANRQTSLLGGIGNLVSGAASLSNLGGGFGFDDVGTQGNPFGQVPTDSAIYGVPGGAAVGGGRVPLNG